MSAIEYNSVGQGIGILEFDSQGLNQFGECEFRFFCSSLTIAGLASSLQRDYCRTFQQLGEGCLPRYVRRLVLAEPRSVSDLRRARDGLPSSLRRRKIVTQILG